MRAVLDGQLDSVKQLIAQGADINLENPAGWNALLMSPTPEMAKLLIEQGADIHASSQNGFNSLLVAAKLGDLA
ncbi:ankyrin repeat domain-containing protein, partial [Klebsiella pneumoniae]